MTAGSTDSLIGRLIDGRYQVRSRIARGGMATVYLATDQRLDRKVAIKVMHGHLSDDSTFRDRFIQEARSAARLAHPNVVNVFDQGQDSDMAYLVMEYLPGITLRDLLQEHGRLTTEQTLDILEAVLAGLSAAHKAGIVHRDLKPENVLLADDGRIKIGDFGLARAASANTATGAALLGTIAYLSPELVTRGVADARSDIYAVGIMTYEMVTGVQPFTGEAPVQIAYQHANDTVPAPSDKYPSVSPEIDDLVLWSTARDPEERPKDARVLLGEVLAVRGALDGSATALAPTQHLVGAQAAPTPTVAAQTVVWPESAIPSARADNSETVVIAPARRRPPGSPAVERLADSSAKRRRRGRWILPLILVVVALVGATGWYFGAGPGAHVSIPNLANDTEKQARTELTGLGLVAAQVTTTRSDPNVASGRVSGTSPTEGASIVKGSTVTIVMSSGPALIQLPTLTGLDLDAAKAAIKKAGFLVGTPIIRQFDAKATKGTVLDYLNSSGASLKSESTYYQQRPIQLVVSAGALPNVSGLSLAAAQAALKRVHLTGEAGSEAYSSTIQANDVIQIDPQTNSAGVGRVFREGDSQPVLLITSKGPQPETVPNVIGMTWSQAKPLLSPDFTLIYDHNADMAPGFVTITNVSPAVGSTEPKGSDLTITFNFQ